MNKTSILALAFAAAMSMSAQAATVEPTATVGVASVTGSSVLSPLVEGGLKVSTDKITGTVGLGSLKTPDWASGTINYGVLSTSYRIDKDFAFGAGSFVRVVNGEYSYRPFVQATGSVGKYDAVVRVAASRNEDVLQLAIARKF
jgi:hypothetical protein